MPGAVYTTEISMKCVMNVLLQYLESAQSFSEEDGVFSMLLLNLWILKEREQMLSEKTEHVSSVSFCTVNIVTISVDFQWLPACDGYFPLGTKLIKKLLLKIIFLNTTTVHPTFPQLYCYLNHLVYFFPLI